MKNKIIYFSSLILITSVVIWLFVAPPENIQRNIAKKSQIFISNQTVSPQRLFITAWRNAKKQYVDPTMNGQDWVRWKNRYLPYIETNEDVYVAVNSMLQSLNDPYSRFMDISEYENQNINIESYISGIGIVLENKSNKIVISKIYNDSPAQKAELKIGDTIINIDGKNIENEPAESVVSMIRGNRGTIIAIEVKRQGKKIKKTLTRENIKIKNLDVQVLQNELAYIRVISFMGKDVSKEFEKALKETKNVKGLIIDLRGDAGGLLTNAVVIGNMFINNGKIVNVIYRNGINIPIPAQKTAIFKDKPIVILADRGTASASEILTGALRDNKKAIIVGEKTYGKNSIQQIIPLPNKTGMNLTIAKYLMPNSEDIHLKGIAPDYEVAYTEQDYIKDEDPQLKKALCILLKEIEKKEQESSILKKMKSPKTCL